MGTPGNTKPSKRKAGKQSIGHANARLHGKKTLADLQVLEVLLRRSRARRNAESIGQKRHNEQRARGGEPNKRRKKQSERRERRPETRSGGAKTGKTRFGMPPRKAFQEIRRAKNGEKEPLKSPKRPIKSMVSEKNEKNIKKGVDATWG